MAGLYFGIASFILGIAVVAYIIRVIRKESVSQSYFGPVVMGIILIVLGIVLIIPYL